MAKSTRTSRDEHIRKLAGVFDAPGLKAAEAEAREEWGDCWDCAYPGRVGYLTVGMVRMAIIRCARLDREELPIMKRLPFKCPRWKKKEKLRVLAGGKTEDEGGQGK